MGVNRLLGLDALRGIAALIVAVAAHASYLIGAVKNRPIGDWPVAHQFLHHGDSMVNMFFVLSGFVFTYVYLREGRIDTSGRQFFLARFARLYPLHIVTLLAAALIIPLQPITFGRLVQSDAWHLGLNLLLLQATPLREGLSYNMPSWSISVEAICYLLFYFAARSSWYREIAAALVAAALALSAAGGWFVGQGIAAFFVGSLAYFYRASWLALGAPLVLFVPPVWVPIVLSVTVFPAIVQLAVKWNPPKIFIWLGDRSYSLYLIHLPVFWALSVFAFGAETIYGPASVVVLIAGLALALILSDLSYQFFETPLRRLIRHPRADRAKPLAINS